MYYVKKYYRKILIIALPLIVILGIILLKVFIFNNKEIESNEVSDILIENISKEPSVVDGKVNIKGAIVNPGVYEFTNGERVIDVINKSGGLLENSDTSVINLSKNLVDEMVIIIYTKEEVENMEEKNLVIKYIEKECDCPEIKNDACIKNEEVNNNEDNIPNNNMANKISINTATLDQLQSLTGIGESKAKNIIKYREENGLFSKIEDIMNVSGIGESAFEKIKDSITI